MEVFSILVVVILQVGVVAAVVVGAAQFLTRTAPGRRLAERLWGASRGEPEDLRAEVRQLRADIADLQERCDVTERMVARLSHSSPPPQLRNGAAPSEGSSRRGP